MLQVISLEIKGSCVNFLKYSLVEDNLCFYFFTAQLVDDKFYGQSCFPISAKFKVCIIYLASKNVKGSSDACLSCPQGLFSAKTNLNFCLPAKMCVAKRKLCLYFIQSYRKSHNCFKSSDQNIAL